MEKERENIEKNIENIYSFYMCVLRITDAYSMSENNDKSGAEGREKRGIDETDKKCFVMVVWRESILKMDA